MNGQNGRLSRKKGAKSLIPAFNALTTIYYYLL